MEIDTLRTNFPDHWAKATAIRMLSIDAVEKANSGHPGMPMGMADVVTVLFEKHLKFSAKNPTWFDRDRFILSAGHGSMLLYALLYLSGYKDISLDDLKNFRQINSKTAGHPEFGHISGIETTTGPLGQGLANAVGFAIAESHLSNKWGKTLCDHHTFVIAGDGCLMEGISQEAISLAGRLQLKKLIVIWDNNNITIDGRLDLSCQTDQLARFKASGWSTFSCDAHNPGEIDLVLSKAKKDPRPSLISARSVIGFGSINKQGTSSVHGSPLGVQEIKNVRKQFKWQHAEFTIPKEIKRQWEEIGSKNIDAYNKWKNHFDVMPKRKKIKFFQETENIIPGNLDSAIKKFKKDHTNNATQVATRKASELSLEILNSIFNNTMGGSADLTGSNNTKTENLGIFSDINPAGRYIHYGIREHAMAAIMNGLALHGGILPYGGTFLSFSDYCRGAIRLSALMHLRVIYVMTHDSIGLGEDGPTHQPVEHLASLRSIPNLTVMRPCDIVETIECWQIAVKSIKTPSVLALTRQSLPLLREKYSSKNLSEYGAYILQDFKNKRKVIIIATGSEVKIAIKARELLEAKGIGTRVVSMPSWEMFEKQDEKYRKKVLPSGPIRIGIEAGVETGWHKWLSGEGGKSSKSHFIGMTGFGASGPVKDIFDHFGINSQEICKQVEKLI